MRLIVNLTTNISLKLSLLKLKIQEEKGVETLEYIGLMAGMVLMSSAVYIYVSGGLGAVLSHIASIIDRFIAGYAAGW